MGGQGQVSEEMKRRAIRRPVGGIPGREIASAKALRLEQVDCVGSGLE